MIHGSQRGRFGPAAALGAASLALILGAMALLVSTDSVAGSGKVPRGCVSKCDRRLADALAFCARTADWVVDREGATTDGELSACEARAAEAYALCLDGCGVPGDPY